MPSFALNRFLLALLATAAVGLAACAGATETDDATPGGDGGAGGAEASHASAATTSTGSTASNGGAGGAGSVCEASPCGGDLVGNWRYTKLCDGTPWQEDPCQGGLVRRSRYVVWPEGQLSFAAAGTVSISKQLFAGWEFEIPESCAPLGATCANAVQGDGVT